VICTIGLTRAKNKRRRVSGGSCRFFLLFPAIVATIGCVKKGVDKA
jgi:hypothetical protein